MLARARDQLRFYFELNNGYFTKTQGRPAGGRREAADLRHGWFGVGAGF